MLDIITMPFPCINITNLSHSFSKLLTYCNNNYAVEVDWCNCFNNNYNNKCDAVALPISVIVLIAVGGVIIVLGMIKVIVVLYKHYHDTKNPDQNNRNNRDSNNTNIRSNAITNLQPMVIIPIESTSDLPKYENPPEYEKKTTNC